MPLKTQAMAKVALLKFVSGPAEDFKKTYPDWKRAVPPLLRKKSKKRKLDIDADNTKKDDKKTLQKDSKADTSEVSDEDVESENSEKDSERPLSCVWSGISVENDAEEVEKDESSAEGSDEEEDSYRKEENSGSGESESSDDEESEDKEGSAMNTNKKSSSEDELSDYETLISGKKFKTMKSVCVMKRKTDISIPSKKKVKTSEIHKSEKISINPENNYKTKTVNKSSKIPKTKEKPKVVDPFFMTATNEEYVTTQVPAIEKGGSLNYRGKTDSFGKSNSFINVNNRKKWNNQGSDSKQSSFKNGKTQQQKPFENFFEKAPNNNTRMPLGHLGNRKERRKALQQSQEQPKAKNLHPSWEAKKHQSTSIVGFQGKKIVFD